MLFNVGFGLRHASYESSYESKMGMKGAGPHPRVPLADPEPEIHQVGPEFTSRPSGLTENPS
jgi:hypothetical protein